MEERTEYALTTQTAMPVMTIQEAIKRHKLVTQFVGQNMKEGRDYGPAFPGTDDKPTLLKPGAEKLTTYFGLTPRFVDETVIEDFSDPDYPFFFYRRKCQLWRGDLMIAEASGSCNSKEKKYRWRTANRACPSCGKETIIKGREKFGGGWVCWAKKGGCGVKFADDAPEIINQEVGQVENPDAYDLANTCLKMADKRALVAATLLAVNASEFFTQDMEDVNEAEPAQPKVKKAARPRPKKSTGNGSQTRWQAFLKEHDLTEKAALTALGYPSVTGWMKDNPGKTEKDAHIEILEITGKG